MPIAKAYRTIRTNISFADIDDNLKIEENISILTPGANETDISHTKEEKAKAIWK